MHDDVIVTITLPHVSLEWLWEHIATLYGQLMTAGVKVHIAVELPMEEDALLMPWRVAVAEAVRPAALEPQLDARTADAAELGIEVRLRLAEGGWFWRISTQQIAPAWQGPYEAAPEARAAAVRAVLTLAAQGRHGRVGTLRRCHASKAGVLVMSETLHTIDWHGWLQRWDAQQTGYLPEREARFAAMLDAIAVMLPERFVALDLACGPGAISQRLLARFPHATSIAVDVDPVLLTLGQRALGTFDGRLRWIDADLRDPNWVAALGGGQVDAILSTTALHWLTAAHLVRLYQNLAQLLRPGGLFLNGDHMRFGSQLPTFRTLARTLYDRTLHESFEQRHGEDWRSWWDALAAEPGMADLFAERTRRFPESNHDESAPIFDLHVGALRDAGFAEVGVIWQRLDDRILLAVR